MPEDAFLEGRLLPYVSFHFVSFRFVSFLFVPFRCNRAACTGLPFSSASASSFFQRDRHEFRVFRASRRGLILVLRRFRILAGTE